MYNYIQNLLSNPNETLMVSFCFSLRSLFSVCQNKTFHSSSNKEGREPHSLKDNKAGIKNACCAEQLFNSITARMKCRFILDSGTPFRLMGPCRAGVCVCVCAGMCVYTYTDMGVHTCEFASECVLLLLSSNDGMFLTGRPILPHDLCCIHCSLGTGWRSQAEGKGISSPLPLGQG